jgi:hypothetical protein
LISFCMSKIAFLALSQCAFAGLTAAHTYAQGWVYAS